MKLRQWPATLLVTLSVFAMSSTYTAARSRSMNEGHQVDYNHTPVERGDVEKKDFKATNLDLEKSTNKPGKVQHNNTLVVHGDNGKERHLSRTYVRHFAWIFPTGLVGTGGAVSAILALSTLCWLG